MNRRELIKRAVGVAAAAPLAAMASEPATLKVEDIQRVGRWLHTEWPHIVGVEETPHILPIGVSVGGHSDYHVVRCCPSEGWADVHVLNNGQPVVDEHHQCIAIMRVYGDVKLWRLVRA